MPLLILMKNIFYSPAMAGMMIPVVVIYTLVKKIMWEDGFQQKTYSF